MKFKHGTQRINLMSLKKDQPTNNVNCLITTIADKDFDDEAPDFDEAKSWTREAVRTILLNSEGRIALMYAEKYDYYKLPGGGIEKGEDHEQALYRELLEEVGAKAKIIGEVGKIEELRAVANNMRQISYTYIAEVVGETGENNLEDGELAEGFKVIWVDLDEAIELICSGNVVSERGVEQRFMALRDELFLQEYKKQLVKNEKRSNL